VDIKIKFGWNKGIRVITEMNISMDTKYIIGNDEFIQKLADDIQKVVNRDPLTSFGDAEAKRVGDAIMNVPIAECHKPKRIPPKEG